MSKQIRHILFPTDFSALANNALETAIAICKRQGARLHLFHVIDNRFLIAPPEFNIAATSVLPELERSAIARLSELQEKVQTKHDLEIQSSMEIGHPADAIGKKATELAVDLIVIGTHGATGIREFFIGSTAYTVIKNSLTPVLTVPGRKKFREFKKILFPIRATKGIYEKYDFIENIIKENHSQLVITGLSKPGEEFQMDTVQREIDELTSVVKGGETDWRSEFFVCKNYAKKVLEQARREKVDLIVINASLDYKWHQFFVGPYAQQVVNHSKFPVLSYRVSEPAEIEQETEKHSEKMSMAL